MSKNGSGLGGGSQPALSESEWEMVIEYASQVKLIAKRLAWHLPPHVSKEDLFAFGIIGLIDAIHKFKPDKNLKFQTYAEFRIKGAMLDELRGSDIIPRSVRRKANNLKATIEKLQRELGRPPEEEEIANELDLALEEYYELLDEIKQITFFDISEASGNDLQLLFNETSDNPLTAAMLHDLKKVMQQAIASLPEREKLLISLYYYEELTMKEIGRILGCVESRISQLHTQAMHRLRASFRGYFP